MSFFIFFVEDREILKKPFSPVHVFFPCNVIDKTAIWLPNSQLLGIIEGAASLTYVNHSFFYIFEVGLLSLAKRLVGSEPRIFRFLLQRLSPPDHSPQESSLVPQRHSTITQTQIKRDSIIHFVLCAVIFSMRKGY